jgi:hypothetical protein
MSSAASSPVIKKGRPSLKKKIEKKSSSPAPSTGMRGVYVYRNSDGITWGVVSDINDEVATMENGDLVCPGEIIKSFSQSFQHSIATYIDEQDRPFHPKRMLVPHTYTVVGSRGKLPAEARQACMEAMQHCRDNPIKVRGRGTSKSQLEREIASLKRQLEKERGH